MSKHQLRFGDVRWAGRREVEWLNPRYETKIKEGKNGDRERGKIERVTKRRKVLACKRRRRGRAEQRLLGQSKTSNRARARRREITVATHNVRTMAVDGTHRVGRALDVLSACTIGWCATSSIYSRPAAADIQSSPRLAVLGVLQR